MLVPFLQFCCCCSLHSLCNENNIDTKLLIDLYNPLKCTRRSPVEPSVTSLSTF